MQRTGDGYFLGTLCENLVSASCESGDVSQAIEMTNVLFDCGYIKTAAFTILQKLVNGHVKKWVVCLYYKHLYCLSRLA